MLTAVHRPGAPVQAEENAFDDAWQRLKALRKEVSLLASSVTLNHRDVSLELQCLREQVASNAQHCSHVPKQIEATGALDTQVHRLWAELARLRDNVLPAQLALETERDRDQHAKLSAKVHHLHRLVDPLRHQASRTEAPPSVDKAEVGRVREEQRALAARLECLESELYVLREGSGQQAPGSHEVEVMRETVSGMSEQMRAFHREVRELRDTCGNTGCVSSDVAALKEQLRRVSTALRSLQEQSDEHGEQLQDVQRLREDVKAMTVGHNRLFRAQQANVPTSEHVDVDGIRAELRKQLAAHERLSKEVHKLAVQASLFAHISSEVEGLKDQVVELSSQFENDVATHLDTIQDTVLSGQRQAEREVAMLRDVMDTQSAEHQRRVDKLRQVVQSGPKKADLDAVRRGAEEMGAEVHRLAIVVERRPLTTLDCPSAHPQPQPQVHPVVASRGAAAEPESVAQFGYDDCRGGRQERQPDAEVSALAERVARHGRKLGEHQVVLEEVHGCVSSLLPRMGSVEAELTRLSSMQQRPRFGLDSGTGGEPGHQLQPRVDKLETQAAAWDRTVEDVEKIGNQVLLLTGQVQRALGKCKPPSRANTE